MRTPPCFRVVMRWQRSRPELINAYTWDMESRSISATSSILYITMRFMLSSEKWQAFHPARTFSEKALPALPVALPRVVPRIPCSCCSLLAFERKRAGRTIPALRHFAFATRMPMELLPKTIRRLTPAIPHAPTLLPHAFGQFDHEPGDGRKGNDGGQVK